MRVLYDSVGFREPFSGVSRYFSEMIKRLPGDVIGEIAVVGTDNQYLQSYPFNVPPPRCSLASFWPKLNFKGKSYVYRVVSRLLPWRYPSVERANNFRFLQRLHSCDVVHLTAAHWYGGLWRKCVGKKPIVITIHDLYPDIFLRACRCRRVRARVLQAADQIIAISQHTKHDIMRVYGVPEEKITVVYHGYMEQEGQSPEPVFPGMRYLLYVGQRGGYKNFSFFFNAIVPILRERSDLNLVCTGSRFSKTELQMFQSAGVERQVYHRFVPDRSMRSLFAHAECFVYPSRYEGFGIPILDAFAAGCPVVLSKCSCFPEIGGDAALYFEDGDALALRRQIVMILDETAVRKGMVARGRDRVRDFTWARCAAETAMVYGKAVGNQN